MDGEGAAFAEVAGAEEEFARRHSGNPLPQLPVLSRGQCTMDEVLQLLRQLYIIVANKQQLQVQEQQQQPQGQDYQLQDIFHSKKVGYGLMDPLIGGN